MDIFSTTCPRTTKGCQGGFDTNIPIFGSTSSCVRTSFLVRTGFRCVICLKDDQTCTPGHRPGIQALERDSRALASSHALGPEWPVMPRRTCLIVYFVYIHVLTILRDVMLHEGKQQMLSQSYKL